MRSGGYEGMRVNEVISDISSAIQELSNGKSNTEDYIYCFRGEGQDYKGSKLTPTLFRAIGSRKSIPDMELIDLLSDYNVVDANDRKNLAKSIAGQHFLSLSRLLDITFSMLPAIYFASSSSDDEDGIVYVFQFPKAFSPSSMYINQYYDKLINRELAPYYQNFKVLTHAQWNDRIKAQSGGFVLFPGSRVKQIPDCYFKAVIIPKNQKKQIVDELRTYFGMEDAIIYPEKDKKRNLILDKLQLIKDELGMFENDVSFYEHEIREALTRIEYEIATRINGTNNQSNNVQSSHSNNNPKIGYMRLLRKEQQDLLSYIKGLWINDDEKDKLRVYVNEYIDKWMKLI